LCWRWLQLKNRLKSFQKERFLRLPNRKSGRFQPSIQEHHTGALPYAIANFLDKSHIVAFGSHHEQHLEKRETNVPV
jgi:hypothetical protein